MQMNVHANILLKIPTCHKILQMQVTKDKLHLSPDVGRSLILRLPLTGNKIQIFVAEINNSKISANAIFIHYKDTIVK
jgi:hypothetical protein